MTSQRRIQKELLGLTKDPVANMTVSPVEDQLFKWECKLTGPEGSPYHKGVFRISIEFPTDFPFKAPKVLFVTKIYHPNVDDDGSICTDILKPDNWKPSTKMADVLNALVSLLESPNPDDPLQPSIADQYRNDKAKFDKTVKEYIKKHARE
ncbi:MAG: hypothetical protein SGCHY_000635 [Lobulomycetales sp.]